jgi:integrase
MSTARNLKGTIYHNPSKGTFRFRYGRDGHCKTFQTKREANEYQMLFTRELKQNGTATLDTLKSSTEAKAAFTLLSQEDLPPSALVDAVSFYIANTNPSSRKTTFSKATADVMKTERFKKLAKGTQRDYRQRWQLLEAKLAPNTRISDISPTVIEKFLKGLRKSTRYKFYVALKLLWQTYFIGVTRVTKYNPLDDLEPPTKPEPVRKEPYTCDEVFALLDVLENPNTDRRNMKEKVSLIGIQKLSIALHVAFYTGLRASEICRLQLKDFQRGKTTDLENNPYINLSADKTKERLAKRVLIPPCLVKYLKNNTYFNSLKANSKIYPHTIRTLREAMYDLCLKADVTWKGSATTRTTFGTHAVDGLYEGSIEKTARQLGHSTSETSLKHYVNYASINDCKRYFERGM